MNTSNGMKHFIGTSLIFIAVLAAAFIGTNFFLDRNVSAQSGLTEEPSSSQSFIAQKIELQLNRLDQLKDRLNGSIFNNLVFKSLRDFSQPLPEEEKGRENPFAPI